MKATKNIITKNNNNSTMNALKSVVVIAIIATILTTTTCSGQISDGDEQFQVIHQDIGRISGGGASSSPVAAQTTIIREPQPEIPPLGPSLGHQHQTFNRHQQQQHNSNVLAATPTNSNSNLHQQQHSPRQRQQTHHSQATRKPNRITLAVRTSAPLHVSLINNPAPQQARSEPSFTSATSHHLAVPQPAFHSSFNEPILAPIRNEEPAQEQPQTLVEPAQSSFRSTLGHTNSVSSRHSALIAQVAAERAAAAAAASEEEGAASPTGPTDFPSIQNQPSLGSPIEALSVPAIAQVQPPLQQHQPDAAHASPAFSFVNQPEEPIVAPSFDHVLGHGCPKKGLFSYENKDHCDRYYMCTNGTFTEEACPNGLAYSQMGAVYQHCAYNWNVDCGKKKTSEPLASPGCPWQFGIFPITQAGRCSIDYFVCEWGVPETKRCSPEGLFYDDRIKGCQWADQLGCKSEALLNFKCPPEDEDNPYWPYPRYYHNKQDIIVCVNEQPRLVHCNEEQVVDPSSLACMDLKKKKKKF